MENNINNRNVPSRDNRSNSSEDYLMRASSAVDAGLEKKKAFPRRSISEISGRIWAGKVFL